VPVAASGSVELYYETFGSPDDDALLLVNGLGSQCINFDVELCERFVAKGFFVIRFDNRDVGLSSKLDDFMPRISEVVSAVRQGREAVVPYRLSDMADDAVAVLDALGVERAHVVGTSMGGMIVQQLAIDHSDRLRTMTSIMSTTGDPDVGTASQAVAELFYAPPGHDRESVIARSQELDLLCTSPSEYDVDRVAQRVGDAFDRCFYPRGVARQLAAVIASGSRTAALGSVRVPALVLHGDVDTLIDISGGIRTAKSIPGARFVSIPGMGHDLAPRYWDTIVNAVTSHAHSDRMDGPQRAVTTEATLVKHSDSETST
jgi:pimeloyl-ACP methyl ester carboxylesterase